MRPPIRALVLVSLLAVAQVAVAARSEAVPRWATASRARVHPGVQTVSPSGQCTANFVFYDSKHVYLGQAAHCTTKGGPSDVNGCRTASHPLGTKIEIEGASRPGVLVYNSWLTMQRVNEASSARCVGNDFALVRVDPSDRGRVNPSIPFWGGPRGLASPPSFGETVYSYGDSGLRAGIEALSPKVGISTSRSNGGWSHGIYTITPGIFGDSGSAVLDSSGRALGVLSTVNLFLPPGENNATDLTRAFAYMKWKTSLDSIQLATGTVPFSGIV